MNKQRRSKCWAWPSRDKRLGLVIVLGVVCFGSTLPAPAQELRLNENNIIAIPNRTARAQPDGSWRVRNAPTAVGQCNRSGGG